MYRIVSCPNYNNRNAAKVEERKELDDILELLKNDNCYHSITVKETDDYILYFDIDGDDNQKIDINDFITKMCSYINNNYNTNLKIINFSYTQNNNDKCRNKYHVTVPNLFASVLEQKKLCIDFIKKYPEYNKIYDSTVYCQNRLFRLPNQSKGFVKDGKVSGIHIIKRGKMQDFLLDNFEDGAYIMDNVPDECITQQYQPNEESDNKSEKLEHESDSGEDCVSDAIQDYNDYEDYEDYEEEDITSLLEKFPYSKFYKNRSSWLYFMGLCKSSGLTWLTACKYSQRMLNHDPCTCEKTFESLRKVYVNPVQKIRNIIAKYSDYEYEKVISFNFKNKYDILDLKEEFNGRKYDTIKELKDEITKKLMSVCAYIIELECFVIKSNGNLKTIKNVKNCLPKILLKGGEGKMVECNLQKYIIENTLFNYNSIDYILNDYRNSRIFNIWKGYNADIVEEINQEVIDVTLDLLLNVFCNGDHQMLKYVLTWFSNIVSSSDINKVALVIVSEKQGTGKGTLLEFMAKILGSHCFKAVSGIGPLTQKHNTILEGVRLLIMNEAASTREEFRSNFDKLKSIITDPIINIEPKGLKPFDCKNIGNYIIVSNHKDSVVIENEDRRYQVLECSDVYANNVEYFTRVRKILQLNIGDEDKMDAANSFYTYLMNYNDKVNLFNIIDTPLRDEMKERSLPNTVKFVKEYQEKLDNLESGLNMEHLFNVRASDLYQKYKEWSTTNTEKIATNTKFGTDIKSYVTIRRKKDGIYYVFTKKE